MERHFSSWYCIAPQAGRYQYLTYLQCLRGQEEGALTMEQKRRFGIEKNFRLFVGMKGVIYSCFSIVLEIERADCRKTPNIIGNFDLILCNFYLLFQFHLWHSFRRIVFILHLLFLCNACKKYYLVYVQCGVRFLFRTKRVFCWNMRTRVRFCSTCRIIN